MPGDPISFHVTVHNGGPSTAIDARVSDPLPAELAGADFTWTCTAEAGSRCTSAGSGDIDDIVRVAPDADLTYTVTGTVPSGAQTGLTNVATLTPPAGDTDAGCTPSCRVELQVPAQPRTKLHIAKSAAPHLFVPGETLTYTVIVTNTGPSDAIDATVSDPLPPELVGAGFTWSCVSSADSSCRQNGTADVLDVVTVAAGGTLTYTVTGTVPPSAQSGLANTATIAPPAGTTDSGCMPSCEATVNTAVQVINALHVTKTSTPDPYVPGGTLTYTVTVTNAGPSDAIGVMVDDPLPGPLGDGGFGWTCLAGGGSSCTRSGIGSITDAVTVTAKGDITYTLGGTVAAGLTGAITNTATITPPPGSTDSGCSPTCAASNTNGTAPPATTTPPPSTSGPPVTTQPPSTTSAARYHCAVRQPSPDSAFDRHQHQDPADRECAASGGVRRSPAAQLSSWPPPRRFSPACFRTRAWARDRVCRSPDCSYCRAARW